MFSEFEWDSGNWPKCGTHGVSREEIEEAFMGIPAVEHDPYPYETRFRAVAKTQAGRYVFIVYTLRGEAGEEILRPISARYMHRKEIKIYEQEIEKISRSSQR